MWDRYDYDEDGNFDEPDGYLDHFQAVHAGEGEEAGGGAQGEDAIWSHRWYVNRTDYGVTGPPSAAAGMFGGTPIGDTGYWIGDYTTEPENGGLGVFAHEYGHDLGLPDLYDTTGGENGTGFWTLMSSGSWMNHGGDDIGTTPDYMGPWEKLQLGWLDYAVVSRGPGRLVHAEPGRARRRRPGAGGHRRRARPGYLDRLHDPYSGGYAWWTGSADDLNTTLTRSRRPHRVQERDRHRQSLVRHRGGLRLPLRRVLDRRRRDWTQIGAPLDGSSKATGAPCATPCPAAAPTLFRFRYQSDGGVHLAGAFLDDIVIKSGGTTLFTDNVESGANGWTADGGFKISTGTESRIGDRYYLAENRTYVGYDETLRTGPYNFSYALTGPNKVERFPFRTACSCGRSTRPTRDNNTSEHAATGSRCRSTPARRRSLCRRDHDRATAASRSMRPSGCRPSRPVRRPTPSLARARCPAPVCTRRSWWGRGRPSPSALSVPGPRQHSEWRSHRLQRQRMSTATGTPTKTHRTPRRWPATPAPRSQSRVRTTFGSTPSRDGRQLPN